MSTTTSVTVDQSCYSVEGSRAPSHDLSWFVTCRFAVVLQHFTQHQFVGVFTKWVAENGSRSQVHVAVGALGLVGAGAIKVPLREICSSRRMEAILQQ